MRPETRHKLDEVLLRFDRIVAKTSGEPSETEAMQEHFRTLCTKTIEPLMRTFGEVLESYGHSVRIYGRPLSVGSGGFAQDAEVAMEVSLRRGRPEAARKQDEGYRISFDFETAEHKILTCLTDATGTCRRSQYDLHPIDGVTEDLIEAELLEMIELIFDQEEANAASRRASAPDASVGSSPGLAVHS